MPGPPPHRRRHLHRAEHDVGGRDVRAGRFEAVGRHSSRHLGQNGSQMLIVRAAHDGPVEGHAVCEIDKRTLQLGEAPIALQVLVIDVGNDRHRRKQLQKRPIALVGLDDHQLAPTQSGVAAKRAQPAPDHGRRIETGPLEYQRNHRRRRRLAVRARDGDRVAETHQLGEHLRPRDHRNSPARRLRNLGVARANSGRDDHHVRARHELGPVPVVHLNPEAGQPIGQRRSRLV